MKIPLPKTPSLFTHVRNEDLLLVELNNTHIEKIISPLFQRMVDNGRASGGTKNADFENIVSKLAHDSNLENFDTETGEKILSGWLQASVVVMNYLTKKRSTRSMSYIKPLSVATYRAGLPREGGERRNADAAIYRAMHSAWARHGYSVPKIAIKEAVNERLGPGVLVDEGNAVQPNYDGHTSLDITQLLTLRFLSHFPELKSPKDNLVQNLDHEAAFPGAVQPVGEDIFRILNGYLGLTESELIEMLICISTFRLFQMPFRVQIAIEQLLSGQVAPDAETWGGPNPHLIYCDFTLSEGASRSLAKTSAARDVSRLQKFFVQRIMINIAEACLDLANLRGQVSNLNEGEKIKFLVSLIREEKLNTESGVFLNILRSHITKIYGQESEEFRYLEEVQKMEPSVFNQLVTVLKDAQWVDVLQSLGKWTWSTGGLVNDKERLPYALLDGSVKHKQTWRYQPSDALLSALVSVCMVEEESNQVQYMEDMPLGELLFQLKDRFGILINETPSDLDSPENRSAASQNLNAFMSRLKQLGCFDGLSDDSLSQPVYNPKVGRHAY